MNYTQIFAKMDNWIVFALIASVSFVLGVILFKIFIPYLRKVKLGQKILEIGPSWHKSKEGTPNLGGVIFIVATTVAILAGLAFWGPKTEGSWTYGNVGGERFMLTFLLFALSQGVIGFVDDYVKLFKKRNKGLSAKQKLVLQFVTAALYLYVNRLLGMDTKIGTPWGELELGIFYYVLMLLAIVYIINCANLTDGIDGLAGSIALIITIFFGIFSVQCIEKYIDSAYVGLAIASWALVGGLLAFLVFNFHPAKIFMGDTGSLFLGGFIVGAVMYTNLEFLLLPVSVIWIIEGLSVVLQVLSFKLTGKRIFKMSPIHHHFEKCGWSEVKIVFVFSSVTAVFSALSYYFLYQLNF